jgi:hypothetical protein
MEEVESGFIDPPARGFSYFEVDMDQNGGLGGVVDYEESVVLASLESLSGTRHANGVDYWVVIFNTAELAFNVFSVTASGVALSGTYPTTNILEGSGLIRISPLPILSGCTAAGARRYSAQQKPRGPGTAR